MFSQIKLAAAFVLALSSQVATAAPAVEARDVYVPHITYPHQGTVWHSGQKHNVTW